MSEKVATTGRLCVGAFAALALTLPAAPALAGQVDVRVHGVANSKGAVRVAICDKSEFLKQCRVLGVQAAARGDLIVRFANVHAGNWAVMVYHDENNNKRLERNALGIPTEGNGISRNAKGRFGPPKFEDAAIAVATPPVGIDITLSY